MNLFLQHSAMELRFIMFIFNAQMALHVVHVVYYDEYRLRELATAKRQEHATYSSTRHLAGNCTLVDTNYSAPTDEATSKMTGSESLCASLSVSLWLCLCVGK